MSEDITSAEARTVVLELSVAALIAQLPPASMQEVVSMLAYVAGASREAEHFVDRRGTAPVSHVRHWATEMLDRVLLSRKASRPDEPAGDEGQFSA